MSLQSKQDSNSKPSDMLPSPRDPNPKPSDMLPSTRDPNPKPSDLLPSTRDPNPKPDETVPKTRDSNPTYRPAAYMEHWQPCRMYTRQANPNSGAEKARNPSPTYPPTEPIHQPEVPLDSAGQNPHPLPVSATNSQDDKTTSETAPNSANAKIPPHSPTYQNAESLHVPATRRQDDETATKHATNCGNAGTSQPATNCGNAGTSQPATNCGNAGTSEPATNCGNAGTSKPATSCGNAGTSEPATSCGNAGTSEPATSCGNAGTSEPATNCGNAGTSEPATNCGNAGSPPPTYQNTACNDEEGNPCQPTEDGGSTATPPDAHIEPYAIAYMGQDGVTCVKKSYKTVTRRSDDVSASLGCEDSPNDGGTHGIREDPLIPNPTYAQDGLNQNPMYVANVDEQANCGIVLWPCVSVYGWLWSRPCAFHFAFHYSCIFLWSCVYVYGCLCMVAAEDRKTPNITTTLLSVADREWRPLPIEELQTTTYAHKTCTSDHPIQYPHPHRAGAFKLLRFAWVSTTRTSGHSACCKSDGATPDLVSTSTKAPEKISTRHHPATGRALTVGPSTLSTVEPDAPILRPGESTGSNKDVFAQETTLPPTSKGTPVVFGGKGSEPGKFDRNYGVAVSADSEIFVTDGRNQRVQVFSRTGNFLRLFPAVVPGGKGTTKFQPYGAAVDREGNIWVVGRGADDEPIPKEKRHLRVVQYNKTGEPKTTFTIPRWASKPSIALDLRNNRIIVGAEVHVFIYLRDGSRFRNFRAGPKQAFSYVATDQEGNEACHVASLKCDVNTGSKESGNIFLTDRKGAHVYVYDTTGRFSFSFGGWGRGEGKFMGPSGICVDRSSRNSYVLVADWINDKISLFSARDLGKFVRTVAEMEDPGALALGPGGLMVVTNTQQDTVTIFHNISLGPSLPAHHYGLT
ncbi:hypothetical protein Bbelb_252170 [Branchiostoma belcheri]|nr:hypothetical protein Bbelb_252170 [Branchiostoma belcheri]